MPHPLEHSSHDRPLDVREADEIAESMRAFSASSRVRLLFALIGGDHSVEELAEIVEMEASAVSQQLRVLRQLHFVTAERDGRHIRYRLHDHHIEDLLASVRHHREHALRGWPDAASTSSESRSARKERQ